MTALDDVSFCIYPGEVHMLLGENGAGKSSLMKVLCGVYVADAGEFYHEGNPVTIASPADTMRLGIAVIFQEFSLVPYLDIAQNIFLGREPAGRIPGSVDTAAMHAEARRILDILGMEVSTRTPVLHWAWRSSRWGRSPRRCRRTPASWCWTDPPPRCQTARPRNRFAVMHG
ncbi:ATP-binding cassette domain-containing protein [Cupriavidus basilensis]